MAASDPSICVTPTALPFTEPFKAIWSNADVVVTVEDSGAVAHQLRIPAGQTRIFWGDKITAVTGGAGESEIDVYTRRMSGVTNP